MKNDLRMYIVVNEDLGMSKGKTAAQVAHACTAYVLDMNNQDKVISWYKDCQKKIILRAHQKQMEKLELSYKEYSVHDNGLTEIPADSLTAICLGIGTVGEMKPIVKRFQLLK